MTWLFGKSNRIYDKYFRNDDISNHNGKKSWEGENMFHFAISTT